MSRENLPATENQAERLLGWMRNWPSATVVLEPSIVVPLQSLPQAVLYHVPTEDYPHGFRYRVTAEVVPDDIIEDSLAVVDPVYGHLMFSAIENRQVSDISDLLHKVSVNYEVVRNLFGQLEFEKHVGHDMVPDEELWRKRNEKILKNPTLFHRLISEAATDALVGTAQDIDQYIIEDQTVTLEEKDHGLIVVSRDEAAEVLEFCKTLQ